MANISVDDLSQAIMKELNAYSQEAADIIKDSARQVAEECRKEIKENSPTRSKKYKRGWRATVVYEDRSIIRVVVHNKTRANLTHLLEYGHAKSDGGRVERKAHIKPAEQKAVNRFMKVVEEALT